MTNWSATATSFQVTCTKSRLVPSEAWRLPGPAGDRSRVMTGAVPEFALRQLPLPSARIRK